jgi:hypothetical protein
MVISCSHASCATYGVVRLGWSLWPGLELRHGVYCGDHARLARVLFYVRDFGAVPTVMAPAVATAMGGTP